MEQTVDKRMSFAPSAYSANNSISNTNKASFIHKIANPTLNANNAEESATNLNGNYLSTYAIMPNVENNSNPNARMKMA